MPSTPEEIADGQQLPEEAFHAAIEPTREEKLLSNCDLSGYGLEIGPSYNPVVPKKSGYRVDTLDHANADTLRQKYKDHNIDLDKIEDVTFVWNGEPLDALTGKSDYYDWIIASHVIEHTTDLVSFLSQCEKMLKVGGILSLAIPDHRYCFDVFRPVSTCGDVVQAYLEQTKTHSPGALFDHFSMGATKGGAMAWDKESAGAYALIHPTVDHAQWILQHVQRTKEYLDIHNWRFTPASFQLIMADMVSLGYLRMEIKNQLPTTGFEFFCQLEKVHSGSGSSESGPSRLELLLALANESK